MNGKGTNGSDDGNGASEKDSEYYASKGSGRHGNGEGGHARRRLDEMISQRMPAQPDSEEMPEKESMAETPSSEQASSPSKEEQPDKGAPDEG